MEDRSAFVIAYSFVLFVGFLEGLFVGWLLWN
jgi:hypothetical protein